MIKSLKYHFVALVFLQFLLCFLYGYHKVYDSRPFSIHQWRQTDCASFTKNYYEEGMHFFQPKIHWQGNMEGKTVSEFPLVNYTVACLWKVFGEHEYLYRFTVLSIYIIALLFLFACIYSTSSSLVYSYFGTSLITTSPLLAYYSFNFLADVPALSFAIISFSLFIIFLKNKNQKIFFISILCGTIATLLKASSVTVLLIIGVISLISIVKFPKNLFEQNSPFKSKVIPLISLLISVIIIFAWYRFAFLYNHKNSNGVFLMETLPIWKMDKETMLKTAKLLYSKQFSMYFNRGILLLLCCLAGWLLLHIKLLNSYLKIAFIIALISFFAFIILFFQVFDVHDYYLITTMLFPVIIIVCFGAYLKSLSFHFSKKIMVACICVFAFNTMYCSAIVRLRNTSNDKFCNYYPFISNEEKDFSDWFHYNYNLTLKPYETITPYLRSLGIKRTDMVLSAPDPSFNITLYLMDQKGTTATEQSLINHPDQINNLTPSHTKYIILNDTTLLQKTTLNTLNITNIGHYKNIGIYKLN